jgi:AcrR family transcriptional regulator
VSRADARESRRRSLVEVGKRLFSDQAYDDVSTSDIANAAGISAGLLYHHFGHKKGFYVATIRAAADEVLAVTQFPTDQPFAASAPGALAGFVAFVENNRGLYLGLMRGGVGADPEVHAIVEGVRTALLSRVLAAAGAQPTPALNLRLYAWLGLVEFATIRWLELREVSRDELLAYLLAAASPELLTLEAS